MSGYGFWGIRDRRHRRFNLVSCVKAAKGYYHSSQKESELIKILDYDLIKEGTPIGADVITEVPSESVDSKPYLVTLKSVPLENNKEKYAVIYDIDADHTCKLRSTRISTRFTHREVFMDFHVGMAYFALIENELKLNKNIIPLEMCPFVIPSQRMVNFYNKISKRVIVQYKENGKSIKRSTNQAEREILLWQLVSKYGHDETCFSKEKLIKYKW